MIIPPDSARRRLLRVTKRQPCPICGKPDYCSVRADGGMVICMRVASARTTRNGGFVHRLNDAPSVCLTRPVHRTPVLSPRDPRELEEIHRRHVAAVTATRLHDLVTQLGVSSASLRRIGTGWNGRAWSWPMRDADSRVTGLRYRHPNSGKKWSERGGREGVFGNCASHEPSTALLVVEGPTDLAALFDLLSEAPALARCRAVGRPSCTGAKSSLRQLCLNLRPRKIGIIADGDTPGRRGAHALAQTLCQDGFPVRVVTPPVGFKDLRNWRKAGATGADLLALLRCPGERRDHNG